MTRATLDTVAAHAGVSKATASKVFNARPDVAVATRELVFRAAQEVGYVPSPRRAGSTMIGVVFDNVANYYAPLLLEGVLDEAQTRGITVLIAESSSQPSGPGQPGSAGWIRDMQRQGLGGVILVTTAVTVEEMAATADGGMPLVAIDPASEPPDSVTSIGATNWRGGVQATDHLLALGHRRIAFVGGMRTSKPAAERAAGYRSALVAGGMSVDPALICQRDFTYEAGLELAGELLEGDAPPTAVFAACDAVAFGVIEAARQHGIRVPDELSVVGFDDTHAARWGVPQLTTVRQPLAEMGRAAVRTVAELARTGAATAHPVELATELVVRGSTGPV